MSGNIKSRISTNNSQQNGSGNILRFERNWTYHPKGTLVLHNLKFLKALCSCFGSQMLQQGQSLKAELSKDSSEETF